MRSNIADYNAVVEAASKFTRSVAEGNSKYAKELFTEDACLFGFLNGKFERGSIEQFYHNVDTVGAGEEFKTTSPEGYGTALQRDGLLEEYLPPDARGSGKAIQEHEVR